MSGATSARRRLLASLLACLSEAGCAHWRAMTEKGTPDEVIQREAAGDQVDLINGVQQSIWGDRAGQMNNPFR
jgi:hypothetical protein